MSKSKGLISRLIHRAMPGLVVGVLLVLLVLFAPSATGVKQAAYDLYKHAVFIHPFLLALAAFVVSSSVVIQGADIAERLETYFLVPLLEFMAHLFAAGVGALVPLHFVVESATPICGNTGKLVGTWLALLVLATAVIATQLVVEQRTQERKQRTMGLAERASNNQLLLFLLYAVLALSAMLYTARLSDGTVELISSAQSQVSRLACWVADR